jgi:hypothetical protein
VRCELTQAAKLRAAFIRAHLSEFYRPRVGSLPNYGLRVCLDIVRIRACLEVENAVFKNHSIEKP